jgi:hypothetical protein
LFDKRCDERNIDVISIIINFYYLRRRRKMFRNVEISILSSFAGELGPVNVGGRGREFFKIIITRVRGMT